MPSKIIKGTGEPPLEVVIAGAGVAGLEALIALDRLAGPRVRVELIAPEQEFVYRPLAVAEPFRLATPARVPLRELAERHGAHHRRDALGSVNPEQHTLQTTSGRLVHYEALLLAMGTRPVEAVHGALTFRGPDDVAAFGRLLRELESGEVRSVAFALPERAQWPLPLYELALLSAAHLAARGAAPIAWKLVTHEHAPLEAFGERASEEVAELLQGAGIEFVGSRQPHLAKDGLLLLEDGDGLEAERVVALPELQVPYFPGVPRGPGGFIPTDALGRVRGLRSVYAAGDATTFPIKQGGLAAQQADAVAAELAALAGVPVERRPPDLRLRAALLTGSAPRFLRAAIDDPDTTSTAGRNVLWWPPGKIAARHLAPYLAGRTGVAGEALTPLDDVEPLLGEDPETAEMDRRDALELTLTMADMDATSGDYESALGWLEVVEKLNVTLPPEYAERRDEWTRARLRSGAE
jgi:sulfide:quinone oxidoreductase